MSINKTRAWVAGTVVVALLLAVAAWFLLISPNRAEAADLQAQAAAVQQQNTETKARIAGLKKEFANLAQHQAELKSLQVEMPLDVKLSTLTRQLEKAAKDSGTILDSVSPTTPAAVAAPAPTASATATATPTASGSADGSSSQATPATSSGLVTVPVSVVVTGNYTDNLEFLKALQTSIGRNYLVSGLEIGEPKLLGDGDVEAAQAKGWTTMTITGSVFVLPEGASAAAPSTASTAAAGAATANN